MGDDAIRLGPHRLEQCPLRILTNPGKWTLQGHSKAGERTCFWVEPLKICLDAGLSTYRCPKAVFISHTHSDHSVGIVGIFNRRKTPFPGQEHLKGRPLYFPKSGHGPITNLFHSIRCLGKGELFDKPDNVDEILNRIMIESCPVEPGQTFMVPGLNNIQVETLTAHHSVDSIGYGFSTVRSKLKPEYIEMAKNDKNAFIELKKTVEVNHIVAVPELLFFSDSTIQNLTEHNEWEKYPVIIVECTGFIEVHTPDDAYERKHTHWEHLFPVMLNHEQTHPGKEWIIIHTSMAMSNANLDKYQKILNDNKINGFLWKVDNKLLHL